MLLWDEEKAFLILIGREWNKIHPSLIHGLMWSILPCPAMVIFRIDKENAHQRKINSARIDIVRTKFKETYPQPMLPLYAIKNSKCYSDKLLHPSGQDSRFSRLYPQRSLESFSHIFAPVGCSLRSVHIALLDPFGFGFLMCCIAAFFYSSAYWSRALASQTTK